MSVKALLLFSSFILVAVLAVGGCKKNSESSHFLYEREFKAYLDSTFAIKNTAQDIVYFVFPFSSCDYCLQKSCQVLSDIKTQKKLVIILVGDLQNQSIEKLSFFKLPFVKLHDVNQEAYRFGFGLAKPMLVKMKDSRCVFGKEISDDLINQLPEMME